MALVYGINDQFHSGKYPLLREKSVIFFSVSIGCDVLPNPSIDGIGTKNLNGIVVTIEQKNYEDWIIASLSKHGKQSKEMILTYIKSLWMIKLLKSIAQVFIICIALQGFSRISEIFFKFKGYFQKRSTCL